MLVGVGKIERLAVLAAVDLRAGPKLLFDLVAVEKPTLEMAGAQLALLVLLIAGALPGEPALDLGSAAKRRDQAGVNRFRFRFGMQRFRHGCPERRV